MAKSTNERSWLIPIATVIVTALGVCGLISVAGLYFFFGPGSIGTKSPTPLAVFLTPTRTSTPLATALLFASDTPVALVTGTRLAAPLATRAPAAATSGAVIGKIAFSIDR